jgi:hypothetical protein
MVRKLATAQSMRQSTKLHNQCQFFRTSKDAHASSFAPILNPRTRANRRTSHSNTRLWKEGLRKFIHLCSQLLDRAISGPNRRPHNRM